MKVLWLILKRPVDALQMVLGELCIMLCLMFYSLAVTFVGRHINI